MGLKPASTVLSAEEEAVAVAFRQHTHLPLDDCRYTLQQIIPYLSRSAVPRLLQRHGISRLPVAETTEQKKTRKLSGWLSPR